MDWLRNIAGCFELSRGGKNNLQAMEGMRGVAVFLVFVVHYNSLIAPWLTDAWQGHTIFHILTEFGHTGVDLFFILSGYLIYGSLLSPRAFNTTRYIKARVKRLYPTFLVMLAVYWVLYSTIQSGASPIPKGGFEQLYYLLANISMNPYLFGEEPMITVAWTLAYEITFYAIAPIVLVGMGWRHVSPSTRLLTVFIATCAMGVFFHFVPGPERAILFLVGMLLSEVRDHVGKRLVIPPICGGLLALLGVAGTVICGWSLMITVSFIMVGFGCLVWSGLDVNRTMLTWPPLRYLGNMSYSYYLAHGLGLHIAAMLLSRIMPPDASWNAGGYALLMPVFFVVTLCVSAGLYLCVEYPASLRKKT